MPMHHVTTNSVFHMHCIFVMMQRKATGGPAAAVDHPTQPRLILAQSCSNASGLKKHNSVSAG